MCRLTAYAGPAIPLENITVRPTHSLLEQSQHAAQAKLAVNGDGFGIAWYDDGDLPGLLYHARQGSTDSEMIFLTLLANGLASDPQRAMSATIAQLGEGLEPVKITCVFTDGQTLYGFRYACLKQSPARCGVAMCSIRRLRAPWWLSISCCIRLGRPVNGSLCPPSTR